VIAGVDLLIGHHELARRLFFAKQRASGPATTRR
jgi:hypothetical protein